MDSRRTRSSAGVASICAEDASSKRRIRLFASALVTVALAASCGGKKPSPGPEPVAECVQYEAKLKACLHRDVPIASQAALLPKSDEERAQVKALCSENLKRIQVACR